MKVFLAAWAVFLFSLSAPAADCPLTLGASDAGWYSAANYHDPNNNNYLVGYHAGSTTEYRDWFVFDLPAFASSIGSAELRLFTFSISSAQGMETLELHHVSTPITTLVAGAGAGITNVFNDLADGTLYGLRTILVSEGNSYITIPLNSNAVAAIGAAAGQRFALGGRLSSISTMPTSDERLFSFSSGTGVYVELKLTFIGGTAPVVIQQPRPLISLATGGATNISVNVCGTAPLRYQWFVNSVFANNFPLPNQTNSTLALSNVNFTYAGDYFVVVTNAFGAATSSVANLIVNGSPPQISGLPDLVTAIGFPVSFYVGVAANPPARLQWRFNGINLPGATNNFLSLANVQLSDAGTYTFSASNALGMTNISAVLTVEPLIMAPLGNYEVDSGDDFYFPAPVQSSVPLTYQWRRFGTNIPGANGAFLSLFDMQPSDAGSYDLVAMNSYGARTSTVGIVIVLSRAPVVSPPNIPTPAFAGYALTIYGNARGSAPLEFQWLFNNTPIPGATNLHLVLSNLAVSDSGDYSLLVGNDFGPSTSAISSLIVRTQAAFYSVAGTAHQAFVGETLRLGTSISGGPRPRLQWQFNGTNISGATNISLLLTNLSIEQSGVYFVNASNQFGATAVGFSVGVKPRRALDQWAWRNSRPQANDLKHIASGNNRTVAVGEGGTLVTSTNGIDWTTIALGNRYSFSRVTFGNGLFAALAESDEVVIFTSPDGVSWTARDLPLGYAGSLDFVNGEFLMTGQSLNTPLLLARSSDCLTWRIEPMAGPAGFPVSIAHGNGFYVVITANELFFSQDSHVWTRRSIPSHFNRLTFANGLFLVSSRLGEIWTSSDARHWSARNPGIYWANAGSGDVNSLAYGLGQFTAVGDDGVIVRSLDATTWQLLNSTTSKNLRDVVFDGTKFIACGLYGALLTSQNGITWTDRRGGKTKDLYGIIYTNHQFVAVGYEGTILTSPDGAGWTTRNSPNSRDLHAVTYGGGQYVAVGRTGTVLTSSNAVNWTSRATPTTNYLQRAVWGNGRFVAVGENATILSSTNAINWQLHPVNLPAGTQMEGVAYGKGVFVIVGGYFNASAHSIMLVSSNGMNWSNVSYDLGKIVRGVTFAFNNFLAVGNDGAVIFSGNGLVWSFPSAVPPFKNLRHATGAAGRVVAIGNDGTILSYNLYNWEQHGSIVAHNLHDVAYGAGKFVAVGNAGTIVQSDDVLPVFSAPSISGGALRFHLRGGMETEYNVQSSENLLSWENEDVFTNDGTSMSFTISTNGPHRFFRVRYP
ncbi:MAG TPA: immunoglobulin domain-containing protein [Verrucomicrobiae bacterium]|jgi:hypothetical protein